MLQFVPEADDALRLMNFIALGGDAILVTFVPTVSYL